MGQIDTIQIDGTSYDVADKRLTNCPETWSADGLLVATNSNNPQIKRIYIDNFIPTLFDKMDDDVLIAYATNDYGTIGFANIRKWGTVSANATPLGVALMNSQMRIIIAPEMATLVWSTAPVLTDGTVIADSTANLANSFLAYADMDGKNNTSKAATKSECSSVSTAIGYCWNYEKVNANGFGIKKNQWCLPSYGELFYLYAHRQKINYALSVIKGTVIPGQNHWSSTQVNSSQAWFLGMGDGLPGTWGSKDGSARLVRPIFRF